MSKTAWSNDRADPPEPARLLAVPPQSTCHARREFSAARLPRTQGYSTGLPIGIVPDTQYDLYERRLRPGERVYFFSDGVYEATRGSEAFGLDRLCEAIVNGRTRSLQESLHHVVNTLDDWLGDPALIVDDVSLLALEVGESRYSGAPLRLESVTPYSAETEMPGANARPT